VRIVGRLLRILLVVLVVVAGVVTGIVGAVTIRALPQQDGAIQIPASDAGRGHLRPGDVLRVVDARDARRSLLVTEVTHAAAAVESRCR